MKHDVRDYLQRLLFASLLCPVALAGWAGFAYAGFSLDQLLLLMGEVSRHYAGLDPDGQLHFRLEIYALWAVLTFGILFVTFVIRPPHFDYALRKRGDHWETTIIGQR